MNVLAVESSTQACSVSLIWQGQIYTEFEMAPQKHANLMLPMVETVMQQAKANSDELDALAYSEGPGAFTGIRIAAGVVQGLALGWDKPVISVSTLEALVWQAYQQHGETKWLACLDARMKEIYVQACHIEQDKLISQPAQMLSETDVSELITASAQENGVGDIAKEYPNLPAQFQQWQDAYPSAEAIAQLATQRQEQAKTLEEEIPVPVYLRNNVAVKKSEQKTTRPGGF